MHKNLTEHSNKGRRWSILPPMSATTVAAVLFAADTLAILGSGYFTYDSIIVYSLSQNLYVVAVVFVWLVSLSLMNYGGLYRYEAASHPIRHLPAVLVAVATAFLFFLAAAFSLKISETFSRIWLSFFVGSSVASVIVIRLGISYAMVNLLHLRNSKRSLAVVGEGEQCRRLLALLARDPNRPVRVEGIFSDAIQPPGPPSNPEGGAQPLSEGLGELIRLAREDLIDDVAIALPWSEENRIMGIVARLRELPVNVYIVSDLVGFRTEFSTPPSHFGSLPILQIVGKPMSGWDAVFKLIEDYFLALLVLIVALPFLIIIAIAIKFDSPGPVLFRQKRLGFNNQVFTVFKFRTMDHNAKPLGVTVQAAPDDPRVTRLGRYLRRWSLDELPQVFNVLNGTMSVVGPRPHAVDHNEDFAKRTEDYFARHRVKPGITGLAQVRGFRGATDTQEKLEGRIRNDIYYAENWSPELDLWILLQTAFILVTGKNAY